MAWKCPYCGQIASLVHENLSEDSHSFNCQNNLGDLVLTTAVVVCPNDACKKFTLDASLSAQVFQGGSWRRKGLPIQRWRLRPHSNALVFPEYVPAVIRQDYEEACLIVSLSPKASATLSRRCLQGIVRDFWKAKPSTLFNELNSVKESIDAFTWNAIDAVRKIGNIGAHMEKDINLVVDVEPQEAEMLIGLIEVLVKEWYVHSYERQLQMQALIDMGQLKTDAKG